MKNETITELVKYRDNLLYKTEEEVEEWYENGIKILDERWNKDVENGHHSPFGISFCDVSYDPCFDDKKHYQDNLNCVETNRSSHPPRLQISQSQLLSKSQKPCLI